jgi:hypothetical protein
MITIEEITSVAGAEFDSLFSASLPYMEGGTFHWGYLGSPDTDDAKREAVRARFQEIIDLPNTKGVLWRKDGHAIHIAAGSINAMDEDYITWAMAVYGPDANGSKSWLYDEAYIALCKDYFLQNWGVLGYKISCINDSSIMAYHLNKPNAGAYYEVTVDSVEEAGGAQIATIRYRYL